MVMDMNEAQKMFRISMWMLGITVFLVVTLQVCYRMQRRSLKWTHEEIVRIQKEYSVEQAKFESMTNSEFLRDKVSMINPQVEIIGFRKYTAIEDLPLRK